MSKSRAVLGLCLLAPLAFLGGSAPAEAQAGLTTAFVKVDTGMTLQYVTQGDPTGPVVVLLHGAGDSWHSWELVLPHIPPRVRTYALTLRGHGLSDHPALWGQQDSMFSRADQDALLKAIPGSTLITYPSTGHALHWEAPERFAGDLTTFLSK